jgi:hypothetical protein
MELILISGMLFAFSLGLYANVYFQRKKDKYSEKKRIDKIQSKFDEILKNISKGRSKFKTRLNSTVYISSYLQEHGSIDIVYMIDKDDVAIFKGTTCIYTSNNVDINTISDIVNLINIKHGSEITDVVNFFGIIYTKSELEKAIGVKWEDFQRTMNRIYEESKDSSSINNNAFSNEINYDIDDILDKISRFGINSLTIEERTFLDEYSRD